VVHVTVRSSSTDHPPRCSTSSPTPARNRSTTRAASHRPRTCPRWTYTARSTPIPKEPRMRWSWDLEPDGALRGLARPRQRSAWTTWSAMAGPFWVRLRTRRSCSDRSVGRGNRSGHLPVFLPPDSSAMWAPKIISVLMRSAAVRGDRPMNSGKFVRYDPGEEQQPQPAVMVPFADSMRNAFDQGPAGPRTRPPVLLRFVMRESGVAGARRTTRRQSGSCKLKDDARTSQIGRLHSAVADGRCALIRHILETGHVRFSRWWCSGRDLPDLAPPDFVQSARVSPPPATAPQVVTLRTATGRSAGVPGRCAAATAAGRPPPGRR